jgi:hypothetical protein
MFGKKKKITMEKLNKFNKLMAVLHAVQALAIIMIATDFKLPVTTNYVRYDSVTEKFARETTKIFDMPFAWLVISFLVMSSLAHLIISTVYRKKYESNLRKGMNKARWIEYSVSASTMMVAIGMLSGIYDISTLILMFSLTAGMNLMGLVMEKWNQGAEKPNWLSYWIGCFLGIMPWVVYVLYLWGSSHYGDTKPPTFVYFILGSIFLMFNTFAINMVLQYKKVGRWSDYLYGERAYIILSLVAKSLLAWQVFAGTLQPN